MTCVSINTMENYSKELFAGSSLGLIGHFVLKHHEPTSVLQFASIPATITLVEALLQLSVWQITASLVAFFVVLSSSILYYRMLSPRHPLHHIPGPLAARASQLWLFWVVYKGQTRREQKKLHDRYGPVVRVGPNEVSIADAASWNVIYGGKPWLKGKSYSFTASGGAATQEVALSAIRDRMRSSTVFLPCINDLQQRNTHFGERYGTEHSQPLR